MIRVKDNQVFGSNRANSDRTAGDKNISILHMSCRTSDLQFSLAMQTFKGLVNPQKHFKIS